jgi:hypothetical protein
MNDLNNLIKSLEDTLNQNKDSILTDEYPDDTIMEFVDSAVPIHNDTLIKMLADNYKLAYVDDTGLLGDKVDAFTIIKVAIYEALHEVAYDWLKENQSKIEA